MNRSKLRSVACLPLLALWFTYTDSAFSGWVPVPLENPALNSADGVNVPSWRLHNSEVAEGVRGLGQAVKVPSDTEAFAKLFQRINFVPGKVLRFRLTARISTQSNVGDGKGGFDNPRLRIFLFPGGSDWSLGNALWPENQMGSFHEIKNVDRWNEQTFEIDCPAESERLEVALECLRPQYTVYVDSIQLEAVLKPGETVDSAFGVDTVFSEASPKKKDSQGENVLWGLTTDFEVGSAGWQYYILPHFPPTQVDFDWETDQPGEGSRSVRIRPGFGLNSMPAPVKGGMTYTLSMLVRAESKTRLHIQAGSQGGGVLQVGTHWERRHLTFKTRYDAAQGLYFFLQNKEDPRTGAQIYVDAISLQEGTSTAYLPGPYSLGLRSSAPKNLALSGEAITVTAELKLNEESFTGHTNWTWVVNEVLPLERTLSKSSIVWKQTGRAGVVRAVMEIPEGQGLHRVFIKNPARDLTDPRHELLLGQAGYGDAPVLPLNPDESFLGVHYHNNWKEINDPPYQLNLDPTQDQRWGAIHHMGARWIRLHGGRPDLTKFYEVFPKDMDHARLYVDEMKRLKGYGFNILGLLEVAFNREKKVPWFEYKKTRGAWMGTEIPVDVSVWENYVTTVAEGYKGVIDHWEIYNEPNGQMTAADYLPLQKAGFAAAKAANPECTVLGICSTTDFGTEQDSFVEQCFLNGGGEALDVISFHPYLQSRSPESGGSKKLIDAMVGMRNQYAQDKPLWISEVGWPALPAYISHSLRAPDFQVSALDGAVYTARNFFEAKRAGIERYFVYGGAHPSFAFQNREFSSMFEYDGSPSPLYFLVGTAARMLHGATFRSYMEIQTGVYAAIFEKADQDVLVAIWTDNEQVPVPLGYKPVKKPHQVWDGVGRLVRGSEKGFQISRTPSYFLWNGASITEVEEALRASNMEAEGSVFTTAKFDPENGPALVVEARNETDDSMSLTWVPQSGPSQQVMVESGTRKAIARIELTQTGAVQTLSGHVEEAALKPVIVRIGCRTVAAEAALPDVLSIDGQLKEWGGTPSISFNEKSQITAGRTGAGHFDQHPAGVWVAADRDALVIAARVRKKNRGWIQTLLGGSQYQMDSVELFFRSSLDTVNWLEPGYQKGDIKISLGQDSEMVGSQHIQVDHGEEAINVKGIQFEFSDMLVQPGYLCEIRIPWTCFSFLQGVKPEHLGFDISLNLSEDGLQRTFQYTWSGTRDNWKDSSRLGVLQLK